MIANKALYASRLVAKSQLPMALACHWSNNFTSATAFRTFSTTSPGQVTKTLRVLDMDVVKKILDELKSVDANSDQR